MDDLSDCVDRRERAQATRSHNENLPLDFTNGRSPDSFKASGARRRSTWTAKLEDLLYAVFSDGGQGMVGVLYKIGEFASGTGARTVIANLKRNPWRLPRLPEGFEYELKSEVVDRPDGDKGSLLWAGIVVAEDVSDDASDDAPEGQSHEAGGVSWDEPTLPLS